MMQIKYSCPVYDDVNLIVFVNFVLLYIQGLDNCKQRNESLASIQTWLFLCLIEKNFPQEY